MTSYKIKYSKHAEKYIRAHKLVGIRFIKALTEITHNPSNIQNYDIKKYVSENCKDIFCIRISHYRAILKVVKDSVILKEIINDHQEHTHKKEMGIIDLVKNKPIIQSI